MEGTSKGFNPRAFTAVVIAFTGLGLPLTGLANHLYGFAPPSIARHAWMSAHNCLGLLFAGFAVGHVVLNRRALSKYLWDRGVPVPALRREAAFAAVLVAVLLLLFVGHAFHAGG